MKQRIGIVDYGIAGNLLSISRAIESVGGVVRFVEEPKHFSQVDKIVLPGVGSFADGMKKLKDKHLAEALLESCQEDEKITLGICLGMQILAKIGFEHGETEGLALIDAEVRKIQCKGVIPHMGFNSIEPLKQSLLFKGINRDESFYFMHSYELCNYTDVLALTRYAEHTFVSAIEKQNIFGVQFHPENSRMAGLSIFQNFVKM